VRIQRCAICNKLCITQRDLWQCAPCGAHCTPRVTYVYVCVCVFQWINRFHQKTYKQYKKNPNMDTDTFPVAVMVIKSGCRFCTASRALLRKHGIHFRTLTAGTTTSMSVFERAVPSGHRTYPAIFIKEAPGAPWRFSGGFDELAKLLR
jgi:glutaredoxin